MIAMALEEATILIADEPYQAGPEQIRLLKETMLQHRKDNKLVLLSTCWIWSRLCDKYIILHKEGAGHRHTK